MALFLPKYIGPKIKGVGVVEVIPLIITLNNPLTQFLFSVPVTLNSAGLEVLTSQERNISTKDHKYGSSKLEVETGTWPLWAPHAMEKIRQRRGYYPGWGDWFQLPRGNWFSASQWAQGGLWRQTSCSGFSVVPLSSSMFYNNS